MNKWNIGLSPWILADGNYRDFYRGQIAEFALEFHPKRDGTIQVTQVGKKSIELIENSVYKATGEIVFYSDDVCVIDCGICVYNEKVFRPAAELGDFVEVEFYLGIDPFFYFESHYKLPDIPPLIYTWQIDSIIVQSAPLVGRWNEKGQRWYEPDTSNYSYHEVKQTRDKKFVNEAERHKDYWTRSASYILSCNRLDIEAKHQRSK